MTEPKSKRRMAIWCLCGSALGSAIIARGLWELLVLGAQVPPGEGPVTAFLMTVLVVMSVAAFCVGIKDLRELQGRRG